MKNLLVLTLILTLVFPAYCFSTAMGVPTETASTEGRRQKAICAIIEGINSAVEEAQIHSDLLPTDLKYAPDTTTDQQYEEYRSSIFAFTVLIIAYQIHQEIKTQIPEDPTIKDILEYLAVLLEYTFAVLILGLWCLINPGIGAC